MEQQAGKAAAPSIDCVERMSQSVCLRRGVCIALVLCSLTLAACRASPHYSTAPVAPPSPAQPASTPAVALGNDPGSLILAERNAAATLDLATLAALWDADASIREVRGAPGPADDYTWRGRAAILDRYTVAVFPSPPPPLQTLPPIQVAVRGDSATVHNGVDTWHFTRRDGRWWIRELEIDVEG